ncbi:MAG: C4-dicarboxylate ABC transporter permease [Armatimonadetes bacterium CG_4_10_14_3_um_filter_66_18]|nr:TRAP transporter large permease [Armatimonadota bacterium]OIO97230.1 MAG: C4-dicarboxylate ABC transporter permease [Armatimonadetes bacterium CG2_30_66_41]PIU94727.1 MAG: C4-dicarboxylate ABC transporter permease [Armatimonadetes bacterium CG06_land_8_20_14_3_00_66_21]PIX46810.1 MAG: C4-dicarboxylate ABC transporter permease [Armatimonadetes bacterium CG_4_8_14_3_um_filter_66_20]PIY44463.1 MAG: C4-dicarboxylate ABC transporter permease [Armatimonadetes bacterium CG_4_10_14_3_um_filter_66_18
MVGLTLFGSLVLFLALNLPIAVALGLSSLLTIAAFQLCPLSILPQTVFGAADSFTLLAIPLFILAGSILGRTGIAARLTRFAQLLVGPLTGGLGIVTILVSLFFAGISGSGPADVAALGLILIPALKKEGYSLPFAAALCAAGGGIGIIVPPSIALIVYGVVAEASISKLFIAGIVPGILVSLALIATTVFFARRRGYGERAPRGTRREILAAGRDACWGLLAPLIILGGIYAGVFTATEAAAVAVVYAVLVDLFLYHELRLRQLPGLLAEAATTAAVVMLIVTTASVFAWVLSHEGLAAAAGDAIASFTQNRVLVLLLVNAVILVAGLFMDAISIFYIFVPLFLPVLTKLGVDPVHFGALMTVNLAIGQITPPVGVNLFVACGISGVEPRQVSRAVLPLIGAEVLALLLVTFVPQLSLWLPTALAAK